MKSKDNETIKYAQMGRAALLPGMVHLLDIMQAHIDKFRRDLEAAGIEPRRRGRGRPRNEAAAIEGRSASGWPADPEERKAEMKRRMAVSAAKHAREEKKKARAEKKIPSHPRDANHPGHKEWLRKMRRGARARWAGMSAAERKANLAKMTEGRGAKRIPTLAVAS